MNKFVSLIFFLLIACASEPHGLQHINTVEPFDLSLFRPYSQKGSGRIYGQAFLKTGGGDVKVAAGDIIELWPATPFVKDIRRIKDAGYGVANLTNEMVLQMKPFVRETVGDAQGGFEFNDLPAGEYMLETYLIWKVVGRNGLENTGGLITAFVEIKGEEAKRVILTR